MHHNDCNDVMNKPNHTPKTLHDLKRHTQNGSKKPRSQQFSSLPSSHTVEDQDTQPTLESRNQTKRGQRFIKPQLSIKTKTRKNTTKEQTSKITQNSFSIRLHHNRRTEQHTIRLTSQNHRRNQMKIQNAIHSRPETLTAK